MPTRSMKQDDALEDFAIREIALNNVTKRVYIAGIHRRQSVREIWQN